VSRIVLKCGGAVADGASRAALELAADGHEVCLVHGAGPQISAELRRLGLEVAFVRGRRVTSAETLEVVRRSFAAVNEAVCAAIGPAAVGLLGDELGLRARRLPELGLVGDPIPGPVPAVDAALAAGRIPVVAPLAAGPLNVNADEAAAALAIGIGADRLLFLTDVDGVLLEGRVLCAIGVDNAESLLGAGSFEGGIVPKLTAAVRATRSGVRSEIGVTAVLA
jgi:acetylglutamate kinase